MKKITSYDEVNQMMTAAFRRGVVTNAFLRREDYLREIAESRLEASAWAGGLLLFRQRAGCYRMNFYLSDPQSPCSLVLPTPTVLEIAYRPKDVGMQAAVEYWKAFGFRELFTRQRLYRPAAAPPHSEFADTAHSADFPAVEELMQTCFHPQAGCQPTPVELHESLRNGSVVCVRDDQQIVAGILQFLPGRRITELHHLAVRPDLRRQGCAYRLFCAYQQATDGQASQVWVQTDNTPANHFYTQCGYQADGWLSSVLLYE